MGLFDPRERMTPERKIESSNIRKAREGIASVAHNAKRGVEAIGG